MTQFSSREPFNDDPKPWTDTSTGERTSQRTGYMATGWAYEPRPEYNRPQNNPTNPILVEFRRSEPWDIAIDAALELGWIDFKPIPNTATPAQRDHARKVLTRLANLSGS